MKAKVTVKMVNGTDSWEETWSHFPKLPGKKGDGRMLRMLRMLRRLYGLCVSKILKRLQRKSC